MTHLCVAQQSSANSGIHLKLYHGMTTLISFFLSFFTYVLTIINRQINSMVTRISSEYMRTCTYINIYERNTKDRCMHGLENKTVGKEILFGVYEKCTQLI